jgi:hypothetical protein
VSVVRLGGAVEDEVLASALQALKETSEGEGPLVIDLDELTIRSRAPFEALIAGAHTEHDVVPAVCSAPSGSQETSRSTTP